ncbi:ribosomal L7Ae/L30e/S12e/Gadd45 family protein, partial [Veillonella sp.]
EKKYTQLAETHHIPLHSIADKEALGTAIGKEVRVVVAVLDDGFAKALLKEIDR